VRARAPTPWEEPPDARGVSFALPALTPVVKALLIAEVAVFLVQFVLLEGWFPRASAFLYAAFALGPAQWAEFFPLLPLWQLVSYGFLHSGPQHLLFNLLFLYFLGTMLEREVGGQRFLVFTLTGMAAAGACQLALGLALGQRAPIVGASGGVLAIVCAMATLRPGTRLIFIVVPMTLRTMALIVIAVELFGAVMQLKGQDSGVARFAHLSGGLFGYLAVRRQWLWLEPLRAFAGLRARRAEERQRSDEERLDALLAKIGREGIHALSAGERAFLKRVSRRDGRG
jgi:membrane associated rhomboid family serine protease